MWHIACSKKDSPEIITDNDQYVQFVVFNVFLSKKYFLKISVCDKPFLSSFIVPRWHTIHTRFFGSHIFIFQRMCFLIFYVCLLNCFSHVWLFVTLWTVDRQAPLSMGFFRQEYWSGLPFPPSGGLPDPGIKPVYSASPSPQVDALSLSHRGSPVKGIITHNLNFINKMTSTYMIYTYLQMRKRCWLGYRY